MGAPDEFEKMESFYSVALDPERFDDLFRFWKTRIDEHLGTLPADSNLPVDLMPHMGVADAILNLTIAQSDESESLEIVLERFSNPALLLTSEARIVKANSLARDIYGVIDDSEIAGLPFDEVSLNQIRRSLKQASIMCFEQNGSPNVIRSYRIDDDRSVLIGLAPFFHKSLAEPHFLMQTNQIVWRRETASRIAPVFGLTDAEAEVLRLLVSGASASMISSIRGRTITTIRAQIRSILAKTGSRSQAECILMMLGLSFLDVPPFQPVSGWLPVSGTLAPGLFPRPNQRYLLSLRDGRVLEYSLFGRTDGSPILFCHCEVTGDGWLPEAVSLADRLGLKIIAPMRPGFGRSTLPPLPMDSAQLRADDIKELLDLLEVSQCHALTIGPGLRYALDGALQMPGRILSIMAIRPILPATVDQDLDGMSHYFRFISRSRIFLPGMFEFIVRAGFAFHDRIGTRRFLDFLFEGADCDLTFSKRPDVWRMFEASGKQVTAQGYVGLHRDALGYSARPRVPWDWKVELEQSSVPIEFVIGEQDRNVQSTLAKKLVSTYPHLTLTIAENCGNLVFHQDFDRILSRIGTY